MTTKRPDLNPPPRPRWWLYAAAGVLALALVIVWWPGWRQYPAATSPESMQAMKLLYAACNTRDPQRLKQVEERIEKLTSKGTLSEPEQRAYAKILALAQSGDWDRAQREAFRFAQDQVGVGHPAPSHGHDHGHAH